MTQSGPIIDFFYGRSFSIHSQAPSVGAETQIPCNKRNNASGGFRPSDNGGGGAGGRGGGRESSLQEKNFSALRASVCSKNKGWRGGGAPRAPPLDPPLNTTKE